MTPLKAIREKCLECSGSSKEVQYCPCNDCALFVFRFGKNPNRAGIGRKGGNPVFHTKKPNSANDLTREL